MTKSEYEKMFLQLAMEFYVLSFPEELEEIDTADEAQRLAGGAFWLASKFFQNYKVGDSGNDSGEKVMHDTWEEISNP